MLRPVVCFLCMLCAAANLALNKPTLDSGGVKPSSNVVDGSANTDWPSDSCYAGGGATAWIQVDLMSEYFVSTVMVTSRSDCCPGRLNKFGLDMYTNDPTNYNGSWPRRCAFFPGSVATPGLTVTIKCDRPMYGRYLRITSEHRSGSDPLQLCEMQVFDGDDPLMLSFSTIDVHLGHHQQTQYVEVKNVSSTAECAVLCEADLSCYGFNAKPFPGVICEIIHDPDIGAPVVDPLWNSYVLNRYWHRC